MPNVTASTAPTPAEIFYQDTGGPGRPVVLIHGWPLSHRMWEPQLEPLMEAGFRVVTYDRRGFGSSAFPFGGYDYDSLAADLKDLLDELDLRDAALVGFSMGGGEVARYLGRYGGEGRVARAALVSAVTPHMLQTDDDPDGAPAEVFEEMKAGVREDRPKFLKGFTKQFVNDGLLTSPISDEMAGYLHSVACMAQPTATLRCISAFAETDFRPDMARVTVPTLVVHGDADQIVPLDVGGKRAAEMLPQGRLEVMEGAPHGLTLTHAEDFNRLLIGFLKG